MLMEGGAPRVRKWAGKVNGPSAIRLCTGPRGLEVWLGACLLRQLYMFGMLFFCSRQPNEKMIFYLLYI